MSERIYCSELARNAQAPMQGTAVHVDLWLLLEYPRPWKPKALLDNDLPDEVTSHLNGLPEIVSEAGVNLRVQFIKQAASADIEHPRVFLADGRPGHVRLVRAEFDSYKEFTGIRAQDLLDGVVPGGSDHEEEIFLVCTNGQRDLCCARFGLPLYEALAFDYGQRVWQTTHVGGHRFAPNLLCLPSGLLYGHVNPDRGVDLIARHDRGEIVLSHLRGRSGRPPEAQAAEYFVRRGLEDFSGELSLKSKSGAPGTYFWQTADRDGEVSVAVQALGEILASCGADPKQENTYELVALDL